MRNYKNAFVWLLRIIAAGLMLQTLYFKFTGAEESVYIFQTLGLEPTGRIGTGIMELIASFLILVRRTTVYGALLGMALMSGAIYFHLTKLGIQVMNDGGQLFIYALTVFVSCFILMLIFRPTLFDAINLKAKYRF